MRAQPARRQRGRQAIDAVTARRHSSRNLAPAGVENTGTGMDANGGETSPDAVEREHEVAEAAGLDGSPSSGRREEPRVDPPALAVPLDLLLEGEAGLLGDTLGCNVARVDDRHEPGQPERVARVIAHRPGGLGRVTATLERMAHVVANLDLRDAVHVLGREAAVAHEGPGLA